MRTEKIRPGRHEADRGTLKMGPAGLRAVDLGPLALGFDSLWLHQQITAGWLSGRKRGTYNPLAGAKPPARRFESCPRRH